MRSSSFAASRRLVLGALALLAAPAVVAWGQDPAPSSLPPAATSAVDFAREIAPLLQARCLNCHGPESRKGGLRLDRGAEAMAGGDTGPAILPGQSAESLLIHKVAGFEDESIMPPKGDRLSADEIGRLRAWIDAGAKWPEGLDLAAGTPGSPRPKHWAFQPPQRPALPAAARAPWVRNPIDAFVLERLEREGVKPSPEADRATLARRLSFDLRGLPPTPAEVVAFETDSRPDAYESLVDRFLADPAFGERWGRHWLDLARYADSDGYEKDSPRPDAFRFRDWTLQAFNDDLPYDRFTIEQLAGDLLPNATLAQKAATGFHRNTLTNKEGGVDQEEFRVNAVSDRVDTTGTVWLGLTIGCARCHTHKFDPITQREYYGLFAFFDNADETDLPAPTPEEQKAYETAKGAHDSELARLKAEVQKFETDQWPARLAEWEKSVANQALRWVPLKVLSVTSAGGATAKVQPDGSILMGGPNPESDTITIEAETELPGVTALRLEALPDPTLPGKGPGRASNGNAVVSEIRVEASERYSQADQRAVALIHPTATFSQDDWAVAGAVDGNPATGWGFAPRMGERHVAAFETDQDLGLECGTRFRIAIEMNRAERHTLGHFRWSATSAKRPVVADGMSDEIASVLATAPAMRTEAQWQTLRAYHRTIDPELSKLDAAVLAHQKTAPKPPPSVVRTLADNGGKRTTKLLVRGNFLSPAEPVSAGTPDVLPPLRPEAGQPSRLDLAKWIVSPDNPLASRVAVNHTWRLLFGRPLVASVDDFGTRGELPTHPELFDWLATEYPRLGWSRKELIRLIVGSSTYRQSAAGRPELVDRDPTNLWLARQNRVRLEAEIIRDTALAVSGLLTHRIGGPSVRPPQPPGIAELTYANSARWVESQGADRYRRGLYTWFQRTSPYPMLMTFDAPEGSVCAAKRERSNTPLQALTLLNDATFVETARALASRVRAEAPDDRARIDRLFRLTLGRAPTAEEHDVMARLLATARTEAESNPEAAKTLAGTDPNPTTAAAWVVAARAAMNLDEFVTRE